MTSTAISLVRGLVRGREDRRVRALWRVLLSIVFVLSGVLLGSAVAMALGVDALWLPVVSHLWSVVTVAVVLVLMARFVDRRPVVDYGFSLSRGWWTDAAAGAALGVALMAVAFGISYGRGRIHVVELWSAGDGGAFLPWMGLAVAVWILVGVWEESLFRGLFITNAAEGLAARGLTGTRALLGAWASSSAVFGLLHGPLGTVPEGVALLDMLVVWLLVGGLFGLSYVLSGQLAFPIALHAALNFATNNVFFGFAGGSPTLPAVFRVEAAGGSWSPHGDLGVMLPVVLLGYVAVLGWFYRRRGSLAFETPVVWRDRAVE